MANPALDPETVQRIIALRRLGKTLREIAKEVGCHYATVHDYVRRYQPGAARGEPPPAKRPSGHVVDRTDVDGSIDMVKLDRPPTVQEMMAACRLDPTLWVPQYYTPNTWQGYAKMRVPGKGKEGPTERIEKVQCYQSKLVCKRILAEEVEAAILEFTRKHVEAIPAQTPRMTTADFVDKRCPMMVAWGLWDAHLGMYAWNSETGNDFDVGIARKRILNSIDDMVEELSPYRVDRVVMPLGNDYMHFDSVRHQTAFGSHFLDTDTRFAKVYMVALECLAYMLDRALEICDDVRVLYIPGNHDTTSSFTLAAALAQRYRLEKRVQVDLGANPRKYVTYGGTLLGFDHGAETKKSQLAQIFAMEAKKEWSESTYREIQIGHTHQRAEEEHASVIPTNGVLIRTNPALCNNDLWHHRQGLIGEPVKSVEAWRYDHVGYRGSHVAWARDLRKENP